VLKLDRDLRAKEATAPACLKMTKQPNQASQGGVDVNVPQSHMLSLLVHKGLLALHRPFFAQALLADGREPMLTPQAASFNACVASARKHTQIMRSILQQSPTVANVWWFFVCKLTDWVS